MSDVPSDSSGRPLDADEAFYPRRDAVLLDAAKTLAHQLSNLALIAEIATRKASPVDLKEPLLRAHALARLIVAGIGGALRSRQVGIGAWLGELDDLVMMSRRSQGLETIVRSNEAVHGRIFAEIPGHLALLTKDILLQDPMTSLDVIDSGDEQTTLVFAGQSLDPSYSTVLAEINDWRIDADAEGIRVHLAPPW